MKRILLALAGLMLAGGMAHAQTANVVSSCGSITYDNAGTAIPRPMTQDTTGKLCTGDTSIPSGSATTATLQSAAVATGNGTDLTVTGYSSAMVTINCSGCSGGTTVNFQGSQDGTNFVSTWCSQVGTQSISLSTTLSGVTMWQCSVAGLTKLRVTVSGYSAGTVTVTATVVPVPWSPRIVNANAYDGAGNAETSHTAGGSTGADININSVAGTAACNPDLGLGSIGSCTQRLTLAGCTPYHLAGGSAASTNSTLIITGVHRLCTLWVVSVNATVGYLRIYDAASAPTCSSAAGATFTIPVPADTSGKGVAVPLGAGVTFASGIGYCITGGGGDTDNTNATTGIYVNASYQ